MLGLVSTWMGDPYPSAAGAVAELSQFILFFEVGEAFFFPLSAWLRVTLNGLYAKKNRVSLVNLVAI